MRLYHLLGVVLLIGIMMNVVVIRLSHSQSAIIKMHHMQVLVSLTGIGDPAVSTEARYTRHLSMADSLVPFMDHPGAIEHFPSTIMYMPGEKQ